MQDTPPLQRSLEQYIDLAINQFEPQLSNWHESEAAEKTIEEMISTLSDSDQQDFTLEGIRILMIVILLKQAANQIKLLPPDPIVKDCFLRKYKSVYAKYKHLLAPYENDVDNCFSLLFCCFNEKGYKKYLPIGDNLPRRPLIKNNNPSRYDLNAFVPVIIEVCRNARNLTHRIPDDDPESVVPCEMRRV